MDPPIWKAGDVTISLTDENDWPALRSVDYGFIYDDEPPASGMDMPMWWRHLWGMVAVARQRERLLGYIRNGFSSPGDLLTRLQVGIVSLDERDRVSTAVRLYLRALMWHMPVNRVHAEVPSTSEGESFVTILRVAGFQAEGRYPQHARIGESIRDVMALGFLRRDLAATDAAG